MFFIFERGNNSRLIHCDSGLLVTTGGFRQLKRMVNNIRNGKIEYEIETPFSCLMNGDVIQTPDGHYAIFANDNLWDINNGEHVPFYPTVRKFS